MTGGAAAAGVLAAAVGVQLAQIAYGAICLVCGAVVLVFAARRRTERAGDTRLDASQAH
jgi:hypothetical protein